MVVIGRASDKECIVKCTDEELLRVLGVSTGAMSNMFKAGKVINVSGQYEKLKYFTQNAAQLKSVVEMMEQSAQQIKAAIPKEEVKE
jgi:hypothetical protein